MTIIIIAIVFFILISFLVLVLILTVNINDKDSDKDINEESINLDDGEVKNYKPDISEENIHSPIVAHVPNIIGQVPETQLPMVDMPRIQLV